MLNLSIPLGIKVSGLSAYAHDSHCWALRIVGLVFGPKTLNVGLS